MKPQVFDFPDRYILLNQYFFCKPCFAACYDQAIHAGGQGWCQLHHVRRSRRCMIECILISYLSVAVDQLNGKSTFRHFI